MVSDNTLRFLKRYGLWFFVPVPFVLAIIGFFLDGRSDFANFAFTSLTMYFMEFGDDAPNALVQIARWLAPIATAGTLTVAIVSVRRFLKRQYTKWDKNSIAVFGNDPEKSELLQQLGIHGIETDKTAVQAGRYILLGSEEENLDFYEENKDALQHKDVYLKCRTIPEQASANPRLHLFRPEETSARLFWKQHCLYPLALSNNYRLKVAILGFNDLGEELLVQGLQYNIFSADQVIEYHVFGDDNGFLATHPQLDQITDPVTFHSEPWHNSVPLLEECHLLIVAQQEDQLVLLRRLSKLFFKTPIYVFSAHPSGIALLERNSSIVGFDWKAVSMQLENIFEDDAYDLAKRLHLRYKHIYDGVEETDVNKELEWNKLNTFLRYSNISAANYREICQQILGDKELNGDILAALSELEHIRWSRYHYLNNWKYGIPENGESKDSQQKIHMSLIPYNQLSTKERTKDEENIRLLMGL